MNIQHSSRSDSWSTPLDVIVRARAVLGDIDLDPASDAWSNARVGASYIITREQDGLTSAWPPGSVFLNPPGGKRGNRSMTAMFWTRLMKHRAAGLLTHAIFLAFSAEALQNTQGKGVPSLGQFPFVVPSKRLRFETATGVGKAPSHSNVIAYVPGTRDVTPLFAERFGSLGSLSNVFRLAV